MRNLRVIVNLRRRVVERYGSTVYVLFGSCCLKSLEDFCDVGFVFHPSVIVSSDNMIHLWELTPFFSRLGTVFFDFECIRVAKSDFNNLVAEFLLFFFFVCYLRNLLYKATWGMH